MSSSEEADDDRTTEEDASLDRAQSDDDDEDSDYCDENSSDDSYDSDMEMSSNVVSKSDEARRERKRLKKEERKFRSHNNRMHQKVKKYQNRMMAYTRKEMEAQPSQVEKKHIAVAHNAATSFLRNLIPDCEFLREKAVSANRRILDALDFFGKDILGKLTDQQAAGMVKPMPWCCKQPPATSEKKHEKIREKLTSFAADVPNFNMRLAERHFERYSAKFRGVARGVLASSTFEVGNFHWKWICVNITRDNEMLESTLIHELLHWYTAPAADRLEEKNEEMCPPDKAATSFFAFNEGLTECLTRYVCEHAGIPYRRCYKQHVAWVEKHLKPDDSTVFAQSEPWLFNTFELIPSLKATGMFNVGGIIANNDSAHGHGGDSSASGVRSSSGSGGNGLTMSSDSGPKPSRSYSHRYDYHGGDQRHENRSNGRSRSNFERHHSHRSDYREGGRSNRRSGSSYARDSDRYGHRGDGRRRGANRGNRRPSSSVDRGDIPYNPDRSRSRDRDDDRDRYYNHRYDRTPDRMPGRSDRDSRSPRRGRDRNRGRHDR